MKPQRAKRSPTRENGPQLFEDLFWTIRRHLVMDPRQSIAVVLWAAFTYVIDVVSVAPMLRITSPEKRCGKTTLLLMLLGLVRRPLAVSSATSASLYRYIQQETPTLLMDESEHWLRVSDITAVMNSGHYRHTAYVIRCQGRKNKPMRFSTWCPKVVCGKGDLEDTTIDRCVVIELRRKSALEKAEPFRGDVDGLKTLRKRIERWSRENLKAIKVADPEMPPGLNDRAADNWRPILAIADQIGGEWPIAARQAALFLTPNSEREESHGVRLLKSIYEVFCQYDLDRASSEFLCDEMNRPYSMFKSYGARDLNPYSLARLLRPFEVYPRNIRWKEPRRNDICQAKGYLYEQFYEPFTRYGVIEGEETSATVETNEINTDVVPVLQNDNSNSALDDCTTAIESPSSGTT